MDKQNEKIEIALQNTSSSLDYETFMNSMEDDAEEGIKEIKLKKPINFHGEKIEVLTLDLDKLTVMDLQKAEHLAQRIANKSQQTLRIPKELDVRYTSILAAFASEKKIELIQSLSAKDYTTVNMAVANFLLSGES